MKHRRQFFLCGVGSELQWKQVFHVKANIRDTMQFLFLSTSVSLLMIIVTFHSTLALRIPVRSKFSSVSPLNNVLKLTNSLTLPCQSFEMLLEEHPTTETEILVYDSDQNLLKTSRYDDSSKNARYRLCLLQCADLVQATNLVTDSHFKPLYQIDANERNAHINNGIVSSIRSFSVSIRKMINKNLRNKLASQVKSGFMARSHKRMMYPSIELSKESIIIGAYSKSDPKLLLGIVELYPNDNAYLCNLSVAKNERRKGLARLLCEISEDLVKNFWKTTSVTLHGKFLFIYHR